MPDSPSDVDPLHQLKNQLSIIVSFAAILLEDLDQGDKHREDVAAIAKAAQDAFALVPRLSARTSEP
jgi:hypothetical protein